MIHMLLKRTGFLNYDHFELESSYKYNIANNCLYLELPEYDEYIPFDQVISIKIFTDDQWKAYLESNEIIKGMFGKSEE